MKETFTSNSEAIGTILTVSLVIFIILVTLSILIPVLILTILFRNIREFKQWEIILYLCLILSIFVPKIGLIGPIIGLIGPIIGLIMILIKTNYFSINKE